MTQNVIEVIVLVVLLAISTPLLGNYMAKIFENKKAPGDRVFGPVERLIYRVTGVSPESEQRWTTYAISLLAFSMVSALVLYGMQRLQSHLPLNPDHLSSVSAPALVQHVRQLPHQHQLAELRRRGHDDPVHPDGRTGRADVRLGGGRHRSGVPS